MQIECTIRRKGGSKPTLDGTTYHFAPLSDGAHVADVENDAHIARFLAIPESFRLYRAKEVPAVEGDLDGDGDADRADLVLAYEQKFGKKPHYKMGADKIRAALAE